MIMSLVLKPHKEGGPDDYQVTHGELEVGRIYRRTAALRPDSQWLWALNGILGPQELKVTGSSATRDEALAALRESWANWLSWAELSEA
jgi:hypothetical protein